CSHGRAKRRMQLFIAGRRIAPPRLEERRADRWECVDSPFRENAADQPHAVLAFDPEIIVHRIDRLVPEKFTVNGRNEEGILYRSRSRKTSAALKQTCATGKKKSNQDTSRGQKRWEFLTQRRRGAEKETWRAILSRICLLCAFAPLRGIHRVRDSALLIPPAADRIGRAGRRADRGAARGRLGNRR